MDTTINEKKYKVLPDCIRLIQGDGISRRSLPGLIDSILSKGWSLDNIVFGSGGGLIQDCNRDTLRFALKCNWVEVGSELRDVYKEPATDSTKNSKRGEVKLLKKGSEYKTVSPYEDGAWVYDELQVAFINGEIIRKSNIAEIRTRAEIK